VQARPDGESRARVALHRFPIWHRLASVLKCSGSALYRLVDTDAAQYRVAQRLRASEVLDLAHKPRLTVPRALGQVAGREWCARLLDRLERGDELRPDADVDDAAKDNGVAVRGRRPGRRRCRPSGRASRR
jgi:hypothetical protein